MFADAIRIGNNLAAAPPGTSASAQAFRGAELPNWAGSGRHDTLEVALACARFRVNASATTAEIARHINESSVSGPSSRKLAWTGGPSSPQSSSSSAWRRRRAIQWLSSFAAKREGEYHDLANREACFKNVESDARYQALLRQMKAENPKPTSATN
jgi:hypothetical protein